jgi:uncharacterized protein YcnI
MTRRTRTCVLALTGLATLAVASAASAHAIVSPAVALDKKLQQFTLSVPTEKDKVTTTTIELIVPAGFAIDSFEPAPGWTRRGTDADITWSGGSVPTEEDSVFHFNASAAGAKTYTFDVKQTYSDGSVVDWNGLESSDNPAPTLEAVSSLGGGGTSMLAYVAVALAALALVVGLAGLLTRGGASRPLA